MGRKSGRGLPQETSRMLRWVKLEIPMCIDPDNHLQLFDSSHMPGYDVPHATNDMITRFMGVDFNLLPGILASTKSKIGSVNRVAIGLAGSTPAGMALLKGGDTDWDGGSTFPQPFHATTAFHLTRYVASCTDLIL